MALIQCIECKREVSSTAKVCPGCGARPTPKSGVVGWIILVIIGLIVAFVAFAMIRGADPTVQAMRKDRDVYKLCLESVKASMGNPTVKLRCEEMRKRFWENYNREP